MKLKKILSITVTALLIISVCPFGAFGVTANAETQSKFLDVSEGEWYTDAINYCVNIGVMTGYKDGSGNFGTADNLQR